MVAKNIFYFDNTFAGAATQRDIGPLHVGPTNRVFRARCHGELSLQSFNTSVPFTTANDLIWGLQWVAHGASPLDVLTSAVDDHWFFRRAFTLTTDVSRGFVTPGTTATIQGSDPMDDQYRGQFIKPAGDIDFYVSMKAAFGILTGTFICLGAVEVGYD